MKKIIIITLVTVFIVSMLFLGVSCKEETTTEETTTEETTTEETTTEETITEETYPADWFEVTKKLPKRYAGTTVTVLGNTGPVTDDWNEISKQFEDATGIDLILDEVSSFDDQYNKMVFSFLAGNEEYDLHRSTYTWWYDMDPYMADISELAKLVPDAPPLQLDDYPQGALDNYCYYKGRLIGLPILVDITFIVWNKEIYKEIGLDPEKGPDDWNEIYENGLKAMKAPDRYGFALPAAKDIQTQVMWALLFNAFGGKYYDEEGNPQFNSDTSVKAIEFMIEKLANIAPPDVNTWGWIEMFNSFASGQSAQSMQWNGGLGSYDDTEISTIAGKWGVAPTPAGSLLGGWSIQVSKDSKNKEAAYLYASWFTSPEIVHLMAEKGHTPALRSVMNDPELISKYPFYGIMDEALSSAFAYPGPFYQDFTVIMQAEINAAVSGELTPEQAAENMQRKITDLLIERGVLEE